MSNRHASPNRARKHGEDAEFGAVFDEYEKLSLYDMHRERLRLLDERNMLRGTFSVFDCLRLRAVLAAIKAREQPR